MFGGGGRVRLYDVWKLRLGSVDFLASMSFWCRFLVFKLVWVLAVIEVSHRHFLV